MEKELLFQQMLLEQLDICKQKKKKQTQMQILQKN